MENLLPTLHRTKNVSFWLKNGFQSKFEFFWVSINWIFGKKTSPEDGVSLLQLEYECWLKIQLVCPKLTKGEK